MLCTCWMKIRSLVTINMSNTLFFFFSSRRRHTRCSRDWSSDVCSSDLFMCGARNVQVHPGGESSPFGVNRRVSEISRSSQRHNQPSGDQKSGKPMVKSQLAFTGKLACQAVAGILHSTTGWVAHLSQPSPDCTRTGNGLRPDVG